MPTMASRCQQADRVGDQLLVGVGILTEQRFLGAFFDAAE